VDNKSDASNVVAAADGIRLIRSYHVDANGDPAELNARPIVSTNRRFAEEQVSDGNGVRQVLYRLSKGHGDLFCESCHGSTHAIWPVIPSSGPFIANDNSTAIQSQGYPGTIIECSSCHEGDLGNTLKGPHGMHPVGQSRFVDGGHEDVSEDNLENCSSCHGLNGEGTVLSKVKVDRQFTIEECEDGSLCPGDDRENFTVSLSKGQLVDCGLCHENPYSEEDDHDEHDEYRRREDRYTSSDYSRRYREHD
jgi:hypothetical protein